MSFTTEKGIDSKATRDSLDGKPDGKLKKFAESLHWIWPGDDKGSFLQDHQVVSDHI